MKKIIFIFWALSTFNANAQLSDLFRQLGNKLDALSEIVKKEKLTTEKTVKAEEDYKDNQKELVKETDFRIKDLKLGQVLKLPNKNCKDSLKFNTRVYYLCEEPKITILGEEYEVRAYYVNNQRYMLELSLSNWDFKKNIAEYRNEIITNISTRYGSEPSVLSKRNPNGLEGHALRMQNKWTEMGQCRLDQNINTLPRTGQSSQKEPVLVEQKYTRRCRESIIGSMEAEIANARRICSECPEVTSLFEWSGDNPVIVWINTTFPEVKDSPTSYDFDITYALKKTRDTAADDQKAYEENKRQELVNQKLKLIADDKLKKESIKKDF